MKSMKLYFSLLLAAVMFVMPLQAQENQPAEPVEGEVIETPAMHHFYNYTSTNHTIHTPAFPLPAVVYDRNKKS